ncbi:MAG: amidase family protein, partial [Bacteroidota bacterium]
MSTRRHFLALGAAAGAAAVLPAPLAAHAATPGAPPRPDRPLAPEALTVEDLARAEAVIGLKFRPEQRELMLPDVTGRLENYAAIRANEPANAVEPVLTLDLPAPPEPLAGMTVRIPARVSMSPSETDLAFASIPELAALLRARRVSSVELTQLALDRLKRFDPQLKATVSLLEERALATARERDADLARGLDLGPLHGIPYGAKDLLSARGAKTTWGATPFRDQVIDEMPNAQIAEAVQQLDSDDAVYLLEDLDAAEQSDILAQVPASDRAQILKSLEYPEDSAGRLMQTEFIAVPPFWSVGQTIDYMRETDDLPEDFSAVF